MQVLDPLITWLQPLPPTGAMLAIVLVTIAGGVMRGFTGFGAALVIIPVVSLVTVPRDAVVFHALIEIPTALQLLPDGLRHARLSTVLPMMLGLILAVPIGVLLLVSLPPDVMRVAMSVSVLALVAFMWAGVRLPPARGTWAALLGGTAGGIFQGGAGVGGPPIAAALMARRDDAGETRGNVLVMMALVILASIVAQYAFDLFTREIVILGVLMAPAYMLSTFLGTWLFLRTGGRNYRTVALGILAMTAIGTLAASLI
ncbi:sulfite exporter TauE/SafE family protein [Tateyamaria pelophila]|uniref:sulfite exporter TauE/SafE family protein n=1 Tax=Tateyamaria pelophila TaxID=328415 RepID=UPI001CBAE69C|nr:sulfite exporter TauE/SafE family protein [Tateyamaria pelophila]